MDSEIVMNTNQCKPANTDLSSSQNQNRCDRYGSGCVAQEIMIPPSGPPGWLGEAKGRGREPSFNPDDSISQVPPRDKQSHSGKHCPDSMLRHASSPLALQVSDLSMKRHFRHRMSLLPCRLDSL